MWDSIKNESWMTRNDNSPHPSSKRTSDLQRVGLRGLYNLLLAYLGRWAPQSWRRRRLWWTGWCSGRGPAPLAGPPPGKSPSAACGSAGTAGVCRAARHFSADSQTKRWISHEHPACVYLYTHLWCFWHALMAFFHDGGHIHFFCTALSWQFMAIYMKNENHFNFLIAMNVQNQ